jgi:NodT family efflux transporter outer membrane factor (OMF) lipoprotein
MSRRVAGRTRARAFAGASVLAALLGGCASVGPDYQRPPVAVPASFREAEGWKLADPSAAPDAGRWWDAYRDPRLAALVERVRRANQTVVAAEAAYRQAIALLAAAGAPRLPTVTGAAGATRGRNAGVSATSSSSSTSAPATDTYRESIGVSWEVDLWGRIRRTIEANEASAAAGKADLEAAVLSAQAALAQAYLQLRVIDAQRRLLDETASAYERSLRITENRYAAGVAARTDVTQAQTQLLAARAQAIDLGAQRAQLEHAIAVLAGRPPSALSIAADEAVPVLPEPPAALPSTLLERRPDVIAAERRMAAANAQIGVAQAAFFPTLTLGASGGIASSSVTHLLSLPYRFWSVGPSLAATLFDAGLRSAQKDNAIAGYDRSVATYRQAVLTAFQEVEDNLAVLRVLAQEASVQREVVRYADETLAQVNNQYLAGTVSYLNVVTAQTTLLSARRTELDITGRRLVASLQLLRALGGDWRPAAGSGVGKAEGQAGEKADETMDRTVERVADRVADRAAD